MTSLPVDAVRPTTPPASRRWRGVVAALLIALALVGVLIGSLAFGAVELTPAQIIDAVRGVDDSAAARIVRDIRAPRVLAALLVGGNLAVAGLVLQRVTHNALADPGLIGVTPGAAVAAAIVLTVTPAAAPSLPLVAFAGALAAAALVYVVSWRPGRGASPVRMVLAGVAVNALLLAVIGVLVTLFAERVPSVMLWMIGSFNARSWGHLTLAVPCSIIGFILIRAIAPSLAVLDLGDDSAASLGVRVGRVRAIAFIATALLAGAAVAVAGTIGFVGLVVPHALRLILGAGHRRLGLACAVGGAVLLAWSDLAARVVLAPHELPVGAIMALLGGPFFIALLLRSERIA